MRPVTPSNSFAVREGEERGSALSVAPRLHFNGNEVTGARVDGREKGEEENERKVNAKLVRGDLNGAN